MWKDDLPPNRAASLEPKLTEEQKAELAKTVLESFNSRCCFGFVPNYPPPLDGNENKIY
jgi:hypothetical protein